MFNGSNGALRAIQAVEYRLWKSLSANASAGGGEKPSSGESNAGRNDVVTSRLRAAELVRNGSQLKRQEVADFLGVSTRKIQRMEAAGTIRRCPNLGTVVRYAARDVLRLASAS